MNPVDSPGIMFGSAEGIRDIGRYNNVLVLFHRISLAVNRIPPLTFYTIDKHGIAASLVFLYIMVLYPGEETDFTDIQIPDKRLVAIGVQQFVRQRDKTLSFKSFFNLYHYTLLYM